MERWSNLVFFWWDPYLRVLFPSPDPPQWPFILAVLANMAGVFGLAGWAYVALCRAIPMRPETVKKGALVTTLAVFVLGGVDEAAHEALDAAAWWLFPPLIAAWGFFTLKAFVFEQDRVRQEAASALGLEQTRGFPDVEFEGTIGGLPARLVYKPSSQAGGRDYLLSLEAPAPGARDADLEADGAGFEGRAIEDVLRLPLPSPAGWPAAWGFRGRAADGVLERFSAARLAPFAAGGAGLTRLRLKDGVLTCWIACGDLNPDHARGMADAASALAGLFR